MLRVYGRRLALLLAIWSSRRTCQKFVGDCGLLLYLASFDEFKRSGGSHHNVMEGVRGMWPQGFDSA